jgi:molybdopterin molybdotransferase
MALDTLVARILEGVAPIEPLDVPLLEASGCATSYPVVAANNVPAHATAACDGYCVRLSDVAQASALHPVLVPVVGDTRPGDEPVLSVQPGFCVRITAGAAVPAGTEAVVATPDTDGGVARVSILRSPSVGEGIVQPGSRIAAGQELIAARTRLRAQHLGLIAAAGLDRVAVSPRPRVVVVPIGDELVEPGGALLPGQWSDTSGPLLTASLRDAGALAFRVPAMPADVRLLVDTVEDQLVRADLVVIVDAVGAGEQAVVRDVLSRLGDVAFEDTGAEPVASLGFGRVGPDATPLVVVPHDALSAFVAAELVLRPLVRRLLGLDQEHRPVVRAVHRGSTRTTAGLRSHVPATLDVEDGIYAVRAVPVAGHALTAAVPCNALLVVPEDVGSCDDGRTVEVVVLERRHA